MTTIKSRSISPRSVTRGMSWTMGLICFAILTLAASSRSFPLLPRSLDLQIIFPVGIAGRIEPIVSAGAFEAADFLVIKYDSKNTARFAYDHWGQGGPSSQPFAFEPGQMLALRLEMPAFAGGRSGSSAAPSLLRVELDGRELLRTNVPFHLRDEEKIYFGENPIGGTTDGARFRGILRTIDGRILRGGPGSFFSWRTRLSTWLRTHSWHPIVIVLCSVVFGLLAPRAARWCLVRSDPPLSPNRDTHAHHAWFIAGAFACTLVFAWVITGGSRSIIFPESLGSFYDFQAQSLLQGRLDVPQEAIGIEAFVFNGKYYGYFGPTPAILRIPFVLLGVGFGQLSRSAMLVEYIACLIAAYTLLCLATQMISGPGTWPSRWATFTFVVAVGLGSTLLFLGSRAYIYHEAILCGVAFALWSGCCSIRYLQAPQSRWWAGALICGAFAVHSRPPIGLFALSLLGWVAALHVLRTASGALRAADGSRRQQFAQTLKPLGIGVLSILGVASFNGLSYLKFKTTEGCPLRYNVSYSPERLARIDGRQFHWSNVRFGLDAYFLKPTLGVNGNFPYFHTRGLDSQNYPDAKMDLTEPMAGVPYAMPTLFVLALIALLDGLRPKSRLRPTLLTLVFALVPMSMALFAAIAVSHRYTADFLSFSVITAALGIAVVDHGTERWRHIARWALGLLTGLAACIALALTLHFQGEIVWGVPKETKERYERLHTVFAQATQFLGKRSE